jgi:UDP-N-acetylmuramoyl-L-alanyl-D-glutamate--2,6-diaminopimelate ligase
MNSFSSIASFFNIDAQVDLRILGITDDSRSARGNFLFVARPGINCHGLTFAEDAIQNGATCILSDQPSPPSITIPYIHVKNLELTLIKFLFKFYNLDESNFLFHGITGTNGKTSTAFIAHQIICKLGRPSCYIGTLGAFVDTKFFPTKGNSTPGIFELFQLLADHHFNELTYIFLELSSHALDQKRLLSLPFTQTILLNIYSDHLDYHLTHEEYLQAKLAVLDLPSKYPPIIHVDSPIVQSSLGAIEQRHQVNFLSSQDSSKPYFYKKIFNHPGTSDILFQFPNLRSTKNLSLFPEFNLDNCACAIGLLSNSCSGSDLAGLDYGDLELPPGRSEHFVCNQGHVFIDYAHDPEAMKNILSSLAASYDELVLIFGCGGDRDKLKRPQMMRVAEGFAHKIIFTSDNNRSESFEMIAADAVGTRQFKNLSIVKSRPDAINQGLQSLNSKNILVILGKGHEMTMEEDGKIIPFNDREYILGNINT